MNYTNREVVRRLKQYDMFLNSLNLTTDTVQKERICDQLDKIEKQILLETNAEYEEEYMQTVKNTTDNKRVLDKDIIKECVDKKKQLRLKYLVDVLRARNYMTTMTNEKMALLQAEVVKISGNHLTITDYKKFEEIYLNEEFEINEEEDKPEYAKISC